MQFKLIALIVLIALGVNCDDETEDKTIVLGDDDFSDTIATNNFFVMFFAPWWVAMRKKNMKEVWRAAVKIPARFPHFSSQLIFKLKLDEENM